MNTNTVATVYAQAIFSLATPTIKIFSVGGSRWKRLIQDPNDARIGPWLKASYSIVNDTAWRRKEACLYMVKGSDDGIRYVGISRNGLKHRWRTSPAYDAATSKKLTENQLFHSQCWKHIENESSTKTSSTFEVRVITAEALLPILEKLGGPLSAFAALRGDGEGIVAGVERWLCNNRNNQLAVWNVAMTGRSSI